MEAPTISAKQAKKVLSSKKSKRETIKNVLAQPYSNYWPQISAEDSNELFKVLRKCLPRIKPPKVNVPYTQIKKIPKNERPKFRESFNPININKENCNYLIFGVNDVSKLILNQKASAILIGNVQPRLLVSHIIDQAVLYTVPILVAPNLRDVLLEKCGLSGAVIALTKQIPPENQLNLIQETIAKLSGNYPVPENHIHYNRRIRFEEHIVISDSDTTDPSVMIVSDSEDTEEAEKPAKTILLKRKLNGPAFIPPKTPLAVGKPEAIATDFISLGTNVNNYQPLSVKRLKGNKNRKSKKLKSKNSL